VSDGPPEIEVGQVDADLASPDISVPAIIVLDEVTFERVAYRVRHPRRPTAAMIALFC